MSKQSSLPITPSPSVTDARHVIEQANGASGDIEAKFIVRCLPDLDLVQVLNFKNGTMIQSELTYDTAHALYMALSDALDELEDTMIPSTASLN